MQRKIISLVRDLQNKLLTVVTEGGQTFGFGHITRCISISTIFKQYGYSINFIINGDNSIFSILKGIQYSVFNWTKEQKNLSELLLKSSIILIDSIEITNQQILYIEALGKDVIFIDDEKRRNILNKGFVIDWTVLSNKKEYFLPKKENITYLLGSEYTPLRKEFTISSQNIIKENIESIMVTFGGSDVRNLTPIVLKTLVEYFPNIKKNIVIGAGFTNIENIELYKDKNTKLIFNASTSTMVELMQTSDLAIASGGQTLYELALLGTPTIAILLVENAKDDTQGWEEVGTLKNIGWYNDPELINNLKKAITFLKQKDKRIEMQNNGKDYINPNGALKLVNTILDKLK